MGAVATSVWRGVAQRDDTDWPIEPRIRLALLRGFELTQDCNGVPLSSGPQRLLAYLALQQRSLPRVHIAGILWADVPDERAAGNLRSALWRLKQLGLDLVRSAGDSLRLSSAVIVDVHEVVKLAQLVMDPSSDVCALSDLDDLPFTGELLPGWYDDWIILERERQRQICLHALESLCERWTAAGHHAKAVMAGMAAVAGEPLRESAQRALIRAFLAEGNPAEAIRQYGHYRDILLRELHLEPSPQAAALVVGISGR